MIKPRLYLGLAVFILFGIPALSGVEDLAVGNLINRDYFYATAAGNDPGLLWRYENLKYDPENNFSVADGVLGVKAPDKNVQALIIVRAPYEVAEKLKITCRYRLSGKGAITVISYGEKTVQRYVGLKDTDGEWRELVAEVDNFGTSMRIGYVLERGAALKTEQLFVLPVAPSAAQERGRKKILIDGKACTGIVVKKTTAAQTFYDLRAAKALRRYFYEAGGELLPVHEAKVEMEAGIILCGEAAKESGMLPDAVLQKLNPGGYAFKAAGGKLALAGEEPSGVVSGAFAVLSAFGFEFLTEREVNYPQGEELSLGATATLNNPFFKTRTNDLLNCTALGYTDPAYYSDARYIGAKSYFTHTLGWLLPQDKYYDEHPEYYALQKDGTRLKSKIGHGVHVCFSNPEVKKLVTEKMIVWIKANRTSRIFPLMQGDFLDRFCQCPKCRKAPSKTDLLLRFVNDVAREVEKECPGKVIETIAYVDTVEPPLKTRPRKNVVVQFCNFHGAWYNHLQTDSPSNEKGLNCLRGWAKRFRDNMGATMYLNGYKKPLDVFPSFYAGEEKIKIYAALKIPNMQFMGTFNGTNSFNPLKRYVYGQMGWNPKLDVEKAIDHFLEAYYGPAAPQIRSFFNLVHKESKRRNMSQYTSDPKPLGLMSRKVADESWRIFAEAEKAVAGQSVYLKRLEKQKMMMLFSVLYDRNLGAANLKDEEVADFAMRMGEFCRLAKKFGRGQILGGGYQTPEVWLAQTALLKNVKTVPWYNDPVIERLIVNPVAVINGRNVNALSKDGEGWRIDNEKCVGGEFMPETDWFGKRKNVRVVRRPTSGRGLVKALLDLDTAPAGEMLLVLDGLDNEKPVKAQMEIKLNDESIYAGDAPFAKEDWTEHVFKIPAGLLKAGPNTLVLVNTTADEVDANEALGFASSQDYFWGWYAICNLRLRTVKQLKIK